MSVTQNGKKSNIRLRDFEEAAKHANLPEHFIRHTVERFASRLPKWEETIDRSFISQEQKADYISLLHDRFIRLQSPQ